MLAILPGLFRLIWLFGRSQDAVALENLTLRQQLAIYKRRKKRPRLNPAGQLGQWVRASSSLRRDSISWEMDLMKLCGYKAELTPNHRLISELSENAK